MKLATYHDGSRDGQLVVVSRDLRSAHYASGVASRLQQVLDDWDFLAPQLQELYVQLNAGRARHAFALDPQQCRAPLPRAYQCLGSNAYGDPSDDPLQLHQEASDDFLGPCDDIVVPSAAMGIDFEAGLAAITSDVKRGTSAAQALSSVRLVLLSNAVVLRQLEAGGAPGPLAPSAVGAAGRVASRPTMAFSPVAVTPDALGSAWVQGRLHLALQSTWNGRTVGLCDTGSGMVHPFGALLERAARTRHLRAGTVLCTGPVRPARAQGDAPSATAAPSDSAPRRAAAEQGAHSLADRRAAETRRDGRPRTGYLQYGDTLHIEARGRDGQSLFSAIHQGIAAPDGNE